jgi:rubrerythrin
MDLRNFSLPELLSIAIKSEEEAYDLYTKLAKSVKDAFLKDRLLFIAGEEEKHEGYLKGLYKLTVKKDNPLLPKMSDVPLPEVKIPPGVTMASGIVYQAMTAEKAASDFYLALSDLFEGDDDTRKTLEYLSRMEDGHYRMLEVEYDRLRNSEDYEFEWPMMHAGP